jgi:hypothetical protein
MFHCAGREPCTGSDDAGATQDSVIATASSALVDADWKTLRMRKNMVDPINAERS